MISTDYPLLDRIQSPADLRTFERGELIPLADEIRAFLIQSVSKTGGHLASGLGSVELTIALHYLFDTPHDRLVWDVGHQCYPHKILTGRRQQMSGIRQQGGLSGFPKITESEYDQFGAGHSSTPSPNTPTETSYAFAELAPMWRERISKAARPSGSANRTRAEDPAARRTRDWLSFSGRTSAEGAANAVKEHRKTRRRQIFICIDQSTRCG